MERSAGHACAGTHVCVERTSFSACACVRVCACARVCVCVRLLRFSRYKKTSGLCTQKTSGLCSVPESLLGPKSCEPGRGPRQARARRGTPPGPRRPRGREPRRFVFIGGGFFFFSRPDIKLRTLAIPERSPGSESKTRSVREFNVHCCTWSTFLSCYFIYFFTNFSLAFYFLCSFFSNRGDCFTNRKAV